MYAIVLVCVISVAGLLALIGLVGAGCYLLKAPSSNEPKPLPADWYDQQVWKRYLKRLVGIRR